MKEDSITIGITAFNAEHSIAAAIESALAQNFPVEQILVVDDLSTDRTVEIVEHYRAQDPRIELICHDINKGVAAARNTLVDHARGVFLAFFDDDDISRPNRVHLQRARILQYEQDHASGAPVLCHTARLQIYPDGTERIEPAMGSVPGMAPHGAAVVRFTLMGEPLDPGQFGSCATCSQMGRVTTYRALGGFDPVFRRCEDSELAIRHARAGGHLIGEGDPLVVQRMTPTVEKSLVELHGFWTQIYEKHRHAFPHPERYQFSKGWMDLKYLWLAGRTRAFALRLLNLYVRYPVQTTQRIRLALPSLQRNGVTSRFLRTIEK